MTKRELRELILSVLREEFVFANDNKVLNAEAADGFVVLHTKEDHEELEKYTKEVRYYPYLYCRMDDSRTKYIEIYGADSNGWGEEMVKLYPTDKQYDDQPR